MPDSNPQTRRFGYARVSTYGQTLHAYRDRLKADGANHWPSHGPNTAASTGRLMIAVLGGLADVQCDLVRTRTAEGRSRAKARGQHMGRKPKLAPQQQVEARQRPADGAMLEELAQSYNVGRATISRLA